MVSIKESIEISLSTETTSNKLRNRHVLAQWLTLLATIQVKFNTDRKIRKNFIKIKTVLSSRDLSFAVKIWLVR